MKNYILYLVFNQKRIQDEFLYSLLSLDQVLSRESKKDVEIIVYTDQSFHVPAALSALKISFKIVSKEDYEIWLKRSNNFFLVLKARVLQNFLTTYKAPALFVDTDTFFIGDPLVLFKTIAYGNPVMHIREERFAQKPAIKAYLENRTFTSLNNTTYQITPQTYMYNSGVVGISDPYLPLVNEIIHLIEQISNDDNWPKTPAWDFNLVEQLAFSFFLQNSKKIKPAESVVAHYWFFKPFRLFIAKSLGFLDPAHAADFFAFVQERRIQEKDLIINELKCLPSVLFRIMNKYSFIYPELLFELPANTFIGQALREEVFEINIL